MMTQWTWAAASCRGTSHARTETRRQDAFACWPHPQNSDLLIAVICDGAGSAAKGGEGASLACRTFSSEARSHVSSKMPNEETIKTWVHAVRNRIGEAATKRGLRTRDFASTLLCAISSGTETLVAHVGDGCAVVQCAITSQWHAASWPSHGEYASTTYFVTDDPEPKLNVSVFPGMISALALFSDGIERLALDWKLCQPHQKFFDGIISPVMASQTAGRDSHLCEGLAKFLDSESVNNRTDDDKTVILAVRR